MKICEEMLRKESLLPVFGKSFNIEVPLSLATGALAPLIKDKDITYLLCSA